MKGGEQEFVSLAEQLEGEEAFGRALSNSDAARSSETSLDEQRVGKPTQETSERPQASA